MGSGGTGCDRGALPAAAKISAAVGSFRVSLAAERARLRGKPALSAADEEPAAAAAGAGGPGPGAGADAARAAGRNSREKHFHLRHFRQHADGKRRTKQAGDGQDGSPETGARTAGGGENHGDHRRGGGAAPDSERGPGGSGTGDRVHYVRKRRGGHRPGADAGIRAGTKRGKRRTGRSGREASERCGDGVLRRAAAVRSSHKKRGKHAVDHQRRGGRREPGGLFTDGGKRQSLRAGGELRERLYDHPDVRS